MVHPGLYYKRTVKTLPKQMIRLGRASILDPLSRKFYIKTGPVRYAASNRGFFGPIVRMPPRTIIRKRIPTKLRTGTRVIRRAHGRSARVSRKSR